MVSTLQALRGGAEVLLATMDVFLNEPVMEWMSEGADQRQKVNAGAHSADNEARANTKLRTPVLIEVLRYAHPNGRDISRRRRRPRHEMATVLGAFGSLQYVQASFSCVRGSCRRCRSSVLQEVCFVRP